MRTVSDDHIAPFFDHNHFQFINMFHNYTGNYQNFINHNMVMISVVQLTVSLDVHSVPFRVGYCTVYTLLTESHQIISYCYIQDINQ